MAENLVDSLMRWFFIQVRGPRYMTRRPQTMLLACLMLSSGLLGCFGSEEEESATELFVASFELSAPAGELFYYTVESNVDYLIEIDGAGFLVDENGVVRDGENWTYPAGFASPGLFMHPVPGEFATLNITAGEMTESINVSVIDAAGIVSGQSAFDTIDWLTTDHNNRWCGKGSIHDGGDNYAASAEAMKLHLLDIGFDHVEVTEYEEDYLKDVVAYNYGEVYPDEWIVVGGHFDVAYALTPPGGGTSEGANDDTSGSTVSLEMAEALGTMNFDHTVVAALWACEEEGLLGSLAFVDHIPENITVKAYMNFDMVSLNYPIVPPPGYGPYDLGIAVAGASDENHTVMLDWIESAVVDELQYSPTSQNEIHWSASESCASDHCSFFREGYATFNFFSAGGDASFWQEWHSGTDNLDFMVAKAGGEDGLASGFNTLVWISLQLFIHIDNTGDEFQGRWVESTE